MINKIIAASENKPLEIAMNDVYMSEAKGHIISNPGMTIYNSFLKLFDLWIYNVHINPVNNIAVKISYPLFFLAFLTGYYHLFSFNKYIFENLFFIANIITTMIFFALIRYQIMLHIIMIPFCTAGLIYVYEKMRIYPGINRLIKISKDKSR